MRCNTELNDNELSTYSRQIRLPEVGREGQEKIKASSVVVVGAGALGCPVLQYLTAAGVGTIGILDNDWVDETNLQRQVLYTRKDISKPKPFAAREKLQHLNPDVTLKMHFIKLDKVTALEIIKEYDIVVDCTDNFATRYLINDACVILRKPIVYGAIERFSGQIMVLNYKDGPTLRCLYPVQPHPFEARACEDTGVLGPIAGIIGSMQATEVIKIILDLNGILSGKMFFFDSLNLTSQVITFKRDPARSSVKELGEYEDICLGETDEIDDIDLEMYRSMALTDPDLKIIDLRDNPESKDIGLRTLEIPFREIIYKMNLIPDSGPKVFYCDYGIKSSIVISFLKRMYKMDNLYRLVM